jgi:hypothetical protein
MPRARTDINWDAVKVIWPNGRHTSEELGAMFGISADGIRGRALFSMGETSGFELALRTDVPSYQVEDEALRSREGGIPGGSTSSTSTAGGV